MVTSGRIIQLSVLVAVSAQLTYLNQFERRLSILVLALMYIEIFMLFQANNVSD